MVNLMYKLNNLLYRGREKKRKEAKGAEYDVGYDVGRDCEEDYEMWAINQGDSGLLTAIEATRRLEERNILNRMKSCLTVEEVAA